jgi:hypothetical protein
MDVQILKAFLILTTDICRRYEIANLRKFMDMDKLGDCITVHLKSKNTALMNTVLTKFEMDRILKGYPPFYRRVFTTTGGITLEHPITNTDLIGRGAWVLAVGMTLSNGPIPSLHNMHRVTYRKNEAYSQGTLVMSAFRMIRHTLIQLQGYETTKHMKAGLVGSRDETIFAKQAIACVDLMLTSDYAQQQWVLKTQQIENSVLFESLVGECPCTYKCLGNDPHSS